MPRTIVNQDDKFCRFKPFCEALDPDRKSTLAVSDIGRKHGLWRVAFQVPTAGMGEIAESTGMLKRDGLIINTGNLPC